CLPEFNRTNVKTFSLRSWLIEKVEGEVRGINAHIESAVDGAEARGHTEPFAVGGKCPNHGRIVGKQVVEHDCRSALRVKSFTGLDDEVIGNYFFRSEERRVG